MRAKGLTFNRAIRPNYPARPMQPLTAPTRTFAIGAGLIVLGCSIMALMKAIEAHVWEGEPFEGGMLYLIFLSTVVAYAILDIVVQDFRLVHYGTFNRKLTAEQIKPICRALEGRDRLAAIKQFREAVPEAG